MTRQKAKKAAPAKKERKPRNDAHVPTDKTRDQVRASRGHGAPLDEVATLIGIDRKTLQKYYAAELESGHVLAKANMRQNLYDKAMGNGHGAVAAAIFWAKTQMGWKEPPHEHRLAGPNGGPIQHLDLTKLSDAQLDALERIIAQAAPAASLNGGDPQGTAEKSD